MDTYTTTTGEVWRVDDTGDHLFDRDRLPASGVALLAELHARCAQRDELLAALTKIAEEPIGPPDASHREFVGLIVGVARAAIARATGAQEASRG